MSLVAGLCVNVSGGRSPVHDFFMAAVGGLAALLAVIIAGLAIIVALLNEEFVGVLADTRSGLAGDLWPFWLVSALCVAGIVTSAMGLLMFISLTATELAIVLGFAVFFGAYALLAALNLVALIIFQGLNRGQQIAGRPSG